MTDYFDKIMGVEQANLFKFLGVYIEAQPPAVLGNRAVWGGGYTGAAESNVLDYVSIDTPGNATDFGDLTITEQWQQAVSNGNDQTGVFAGGGYSNVIQHITMNSAGNATDFGDLIRTKGLMAPASNHTNQRGVFAGGYSGSRLKEIDYITINSAGNALDFGDITTERNDAGGVSNGTNERGCFGGGYYSSPATYHDTIDYITINSTGNATDFGDLTVARRLVSATDNGTNDRGCFMGGHYSSPTIKNEIDYITISSTGNATDFGDLTVSRRGAAGASNSTSERGLCGGGDTSIVSTTNVIDYFTINSIGNASDFGDLTQARYTIGACSNAGGATPSTSAGDRGVINGGWVATYDDTMDYITISTTGNATDFGDNTEERYTGFGVSNGYGQRGCHAGGRKTGGSNTDTIDYITINATGNATDFGNLSRAIRATGGCDNGPYQRGIASYVGYDSANRNYIDYITINITGNATDFGDAVSSKRGVHGTSNDTNNRGVFFGGNGSSAYLNEIDYITINSKGNAADFGNLTLARRNASAVSNGTNERGVCYGGNDSGANDDTIDYVTINSTGNATDFGDVLTTEFVGVGLDNKTNDRGILAGGSVGGGTDTIQYITISSPGNSTDFGDMTTVRQGQASNANT